MSRVLGVAVVALLAASASGCNCGGCFDQSRDYVVTDAQVALVLGGTSSPTQSGCVAVCNQTLGTMEGERGDAAGVTYFPVQGCTLAGHTLTCVFRLCEL